MWVEFMQVFLAQVYVPAICFIVYYENRGMNKSTILSVGVGWVGVGIWVEKCAVYGPLYNSSDCLTWMYREVYPDFTITKTCLYNIVPHKSHIYLVKLGFTGVYIIFLISTQKHRLWVLVRTASLRRF